MYLIIFLCAFFEAGPVDRVSLPKNNNGRPKPFAFITYEHACSAPYAVALFRNTLLFGRKLALNSENKDIKMPKILKKLMNADGHENRKPASWRELKCAEPSDNGNSHSYNIPSQLPTQLNSVFDYDTLLQMGQQMRFPGNSSSPSVYGFPGMSVPGMFLPSYPSMLNNCNEGGVKNDYPSHMQSGHQKSYNQSVEENHNSNERDSRRPNERGNHHHAERDSHKYNDRDRKIRNNTRPYDLADHRNRDRKYSSSHMLGHRERK